MAAAAGSGSGSGSGATDIKSDVDLDRDDVHDHDDENDETWKNDWNQARSIVQLRELTIEALRGVRTRTPACCPCDGATLCTSTLPLKNSLIKLNENGLLLTTESGRGRLSDETTKMTEKEFLKLYCPCGKCFADADDTEAHTVTHSWREYVVGFKKKHGWMSGIPEGTHVMVYELLPESSDSLVTKLISNGVITYMPPSRVKYVKEKEEDSKGCHNISIHDMAASQLLCKEIHKFCDCVANGHVQRFYDVLNDSMKAQLQRGQYLVAMFAADMGVTGLVDSLTKQKQ